ncbi:MAG: hypothetical protein AMDU4_FER2C00117G0005 [Ferroplasma sp. Type II]|nr:MAG: hypothetical protein AMDU4_FER2C00117G0005 [Ferroplasma sp. Type II]
MIFLTTIKTKKVEKGLNAKGFKLDVKHDHKIFRFYIGEEKTRVYTKISHGEVEIGDRLIGLMARELGINKEQFIKLIDCGLSYSEYIKILIDDNVFKQ